MVSRKLSRFIKKIDKDGYAFSVIEPPEDPFWTHRVIVETTHHGKVISSKIVRFDSPDKIDRAIISTISSVIRDYKEEREIKYKLSQIPGVRSQDELDKLVLAERIVEDMQRDVEKLTRLRRWF